MIFLKKKKIIKFLIEVLYPKSDIIIVNSNGIKNGFSKSLTKKVKVIYPPSLRNVNKLKKKFKKNSLFKAVCFSRLSKREKFRVCNQIIQIFRKSKYFPYNLWKWNFKRKFIRTNK